MKKFFGEFKTFIARGNVLDMAVGVIVGSAFTAIVNALCNNILKPVVNWILALILGEESLSSIFTYLKKVTDETGHVILEKSIYIDWGSLINAVIQFILIAFVLFCIVKAFNKIKAAANDVNNAKLTREERKEMAAMGLNFRHIADIKKYRAKKAEEKGKAEAEAAEKEAALAAEKAAAERAANPTAEDLLKEILSVLKEGKDVSGKN